MDDLVKRLRSVPPCNGCGEYPGGDIAQIMDIAADRIAALEAQVRAADTLAEALENAVEELRFLIPGYAGAAVTEQQVEEDVSDYVAALTAYRATKEGGA